MQFLSAYAILADILPFGKHSSAACAGCHESDLINPSFWRSSMAINVSLDNYFLQVVSVPSHTMTENCTIFSGSRGQRNVLVFPVAGQRNRLFSSLSALFVTLFFSTTFLQQHRFIACFSCPCFTTI